MLISTNSLTRQFLFIYFYLFWKNILFIFPPLKTGEISSKFIKLKTSKKKNRLWFCRNSTWIWVNQIRFKHKPLWLWLWVNVFSTLAVHFLPSTCYILWQQQWEAFISMTEQKKGCESRPKFLWNINEILIHDFFPLVPATVLKYTPINLL